MRGLAQTLLPLLLTAMSARECRAFSESVVILGLNAALQKRFVLPPNTELTPGNVHRGEVETGVGGKGQDVGVAMSILMDDGSSAEERRGENDRRVLLAQFLGGASGEYVGDILSSRHGLSDELTVRNSAPLRTCTTIVGSNSATELVEASGEISSGEMDELRGKIDGLAESGGEANAVCVMGSMPPGCPENTYADLTSRLADKDTIVLVDSVIGLGPLLESLASIYRGSSEDRTGGAVLKLNAAELCKLGGLSKDESVRVTSKELTDATFGFVAKYPAAVNALDYLLVTDGKFPGNVVEIPTGGEEGIQTTTVPVPDLAESGTLYPIGAGDTVAAGTLAAWQYLRHNGGGEEEFFGVVSTRVAERLASSRRRERGSDIIATSFAFGLACGSASCLARENSVFDVDDALGYFDGCVGTTS